VIHSAQSVKINYMHCLQWHVFFFGPTFAQYCRIGHGISCTVSCKTKSFYVMQSSLFAPHESNSNCRFTC